MTPKASLAPSDGQGLTLWLSSRDAQRLATLARDNDASLTVVASRLIAAAFEARTGNGKR